MRATELLGYVRQFAELSRCAERVDLGAADRLVAGQRAEEVFSLIDAEIRERYREADDAETAAVSREVEAEAIAQALRDHEGGVKP